MKRWAMVVTAALVLLVALLGFTAWQARADAAAWEAEAARRMSALAVEQARAQGWAARVAALGDLEEHVRDDSLAAALVDSLQAVAARPRERIVVSGSGSTSVVQTGNAYERALPEQCPVSDGAPECYGYSTHYVGEYDDGTFALSWRHTLHPQPDTFAAFMTARPRLQILGTDLPDGSLLVTARAYDPRFELDVEDALLQPPPPRIEYRVDKTTAGILLTVGVALGAVLAR